MQTSTQLWKDERTPPSPYLNHMPERNITTPAGHHLTLMNPAYMLRRMEDAPERFDEAEHEMSRLLIGRVMRLDNLIEALLEYSRIGRFIGEEQEVDLSRLEGSSFFFTWPKRYEP